MAPSERLRTPRSPVTTALLVALSVFVAETLVMVALLRHPPHSLWAETLVDSTLLTLLLSPVLYLLVHRPLVGHVRAHQRVEAELRRVGEGLEARVRERTSDLSRANANESLQAEIAVRRRAEEALRRSEDQFRSLVENSLDIVAVVDAEGMILFASPSVEGLLGYPVPEFVGRNCFAFVHPDDVPAVTAALVQIFVRPGAVESVELRFRHRDGSWRILEARGRALAAGPAGTHAIVNAHDITERKRAEEALRASEERLELALWGADLGIWDWNVETGQVVRNERWARMLGYTPHEIAEHIRSWEDLIHPDDKPRVMEAVRANLEGRTPFYRTEYRLRARSGEWRWILGTGKLVERGSDGRPLRVTGAHLDITEAKKMEEALRRAQRLESLSVLAGGVAHDFNNLLGVIMGRASLALAKLPPEAPARANVEKAMRAAEQAAELAAKMLAFSGRGRFVVGPMDLSAFVREHRVLLEAAITKRVRLDLDLAEGLPSIEADAGQIQQALLNLVLNASEAMGEGAGTVTIATGRRQVGPGDEAFWRHTGEPLAPGAYVSLEVRDDGCGMEEATVGRIFDPFFTTKSTGRGLGLAAVLGVVRGHRGGIAVESEVGRGTRLELLFPEARADARSEPEPAPASRGSGVLVVDDDEMMREAVVEMLASQGFAVLAAVGGAEAVRLLHEHRGEIGVVLLDLSMPGMGGEETYRRLREIEPSLRVIVSSGFTEAEVRGRFVGQGLAGFLQKPYTSEALVTMVRDCLGAASGGRAEEGGWRRS